MRKDAVEAMLPFLSERYANPSGAHRLARDAHRAMDEARLVMAELLGAEPGEIIFTSGGTEGDNLAVFGRLDNVGGVAVCSAIEHHAVLEPVVSRGGRMVGVDARGCIDMDDLASKLDPQVTLVSVMTANNEIGVIADLNSIAELVRVRAPNAILHTDAVQAFPWLDIAAHCAPADMVTISAHKFGGPKGVGAVVLRDGTDVSPRQIGGGQERERRSGTQNVAGIVAMARAAQSTVDDRIRNLGAVAKRRDRLADGLISCIDGAVETGVVSTGHGPDRSMRTAGICHICIPGIESEALLFLAEQSGVFASAGASCASGAMEPSHVLEAMGVDRDLALGSIRFSIGYETTDDEIDLVLEVIPEAVGKLRRYSGESGGRRI